MPHHLYQQTMKKLSQSLENRLKTPVEYLKKSRPVQQKWIQKDNEIFFPLMLNWHTAGQIKVSAHLNESQIQTTLFLIQWTLDSLEKVFNKHNTCFYSGSKDIYPVLIDSADEYNSLQQACNLYEQSPASSFIHCHSAVFDRSLFSSSLSRTFIFISDLTELSKENQMFLAHFIRTSFQTVEIPLIAGSVKYPLKEVVGRNLLLPSLVENFVSFRESIPSSAPSAHV